MFHCQVFIFSLKTDSVNYVFFFRSILYKEQIFFKTLLKIKSDNFHLIHIIILIKTKREKRAFKI